MSASSITYTRTLASAGLPVIDWLPLFLLDRCSAGRQTVSLPMTKSLVRNHAPAYHPPAKHRQMVLAWVPAALPPAPRTPVCSSPLLVPPSHRRQPSPPRSLSSRSSETSEPSPTALSISHHRFPPLGWVRHQSISPVNVVVSSAQLGWCLCIIFFPFVFLSLVTDSPL